MNKLIDLIVERAQINYDRDGYLCNVGFVNTKDSLYIMPMNFETDGEKVVLFHGLRQFCKEHFAKEVVLILNSSRRTFSKEGKQLNEEDGVSFTYESRDKDMSMWAVLKDKKLIMGEWEELDNFGGICANLVQKNIEGYG